MNAIGISAIVLATLAVLVVSMSYAYPAFEVMFESKAEMGKAALLNAEFRRELDELLKDDNPAGLRFRADRGVSFTYPGYIDELVAAYRLKGQNK